SLVVFVLCTLHLAHPVVFLALGLLWGGLAARGGLSVRLPVSLKWTALPFAPFLVLYFFHAMAPEASPDGSGYHLSLVARYLQSHGFVRITDNFYAAFPAAVEMVFLHAFAFGHHSAAALVHLAFLIALAWQVYAYAHRFGYPQAGFAAALLVFASPV